MRNTPDISNNTFLITEQDMLILEELIPAKSVLTLPHVMDMLALVEPTFTVRSSGLLLCGGTQLWFPAQSVGENSLQCLAQASGARDTSRFSAWRMCENKEHEVSLNSIAYKEKKRNE